MPAPQTKDGFEEAILAHVDQIASPHYFGEAARRKHRLEIEIGLLSHKLMAGHARGFTRARRFSPKQIAMLCKELLETWRIGNHCCVRTDIAKALISHGFDERVFKRASRRQCGCNASKKRI